LLKEDSSKNRRHKKLVQSEGLFKPGIAVEHQQEIPRSDPNSICDGRRRVKCASGRKMIFVIFGCNWRELQRQSIEVFGIGDMSPFKLRPLLQWAIESDEIVTDRGFVEVRPESSSCLETRIAILSANGIQITCHITTFTPLRVGHATRIVPVVNS
jgi:hypothetical protein